MKTVYIDFDKNWGLFYGDYEEDALWYSYKYNRLGIDNVIEVSYTKDRIYVSYKPTKRSKVVYKKSFNIVSVKNMTIN